MNGPRSPWGPAVVTLAAALAAVGLLVNLARPLAGIGTAATELDSFIPEVLRAVADYHAPRRVATAVALVLAVAVPLWFVMTSLGRRVVRWVVSSGQRATRGALLAVAIAVAVSVAGLPLDVWIGYVHEGRWGFRTADALDWSRDWVLAEALTWVLAAVVGAALVAAVRRWPSGWHWRLMIAGLVLTGLLGLLYPVVIQPLFLDTRPLEAGPARTAVEEVLVAAGEPELPILVADASRRTTRVNALVAGLGPTRRVVLYDNLLELPPRQVGLVTAHELAHREHADILRGTLLTSAGLLVSLLVLRWVWHAPWLRERLDARGVADPRLVAGALAAAAVLELAGMPAAGWFSRRAERAADERAMELTGDPATLATTSRVFTVRDLADPTPPSWVHLLLGTHPTVEDRIRHAAGYAAETGAELPGVAAVRRDERDLRHPAIGSR